MSMFVPTEITRDTQEEAEIQEKLKKVIYCASNGETFPSFIFSRG